MQTSYRLDTHVLDSLIKHMDGNVGQAVAKAAFAVEGRAKINAPVDTGALRASIYTSLADSQEGMAAMSAARAKRPEAKVGPLPTPKSNHTAHVGPSVEYGAAVELGTHRRAGTPYLQPAMRQVGQDMKALLKEAVKRG